MNTRRMRVPDVEKRLPNGTLLTLFRAIQTTRDENKKEIIGDWLVALRPGKLRIVAFFYKQDEKQMVEMIYDKHTMKYVERTDVPLPEKMEYVFCDIEDTLERRECLKLYEAIA